jgi:hypothetical protein
MLRAKGGADAPSPRPQLLVRRRLHCLFVCCMSSSRWCSGCRMSCSVCVVLRALGATRWRARSSSSSFWLLTNIDAAERGLRRARVAHTNCQPSPGNVSIAAQRRRLSSADHDGATRSKTEAKKSQPMRSIWDRPCAALATQACVRDQPKGQMPGPAWRVLGWDSAGLRCSAGLRAGLCFVCERAQHVVGGVVASALSG